MRSLPRILAAGLLLAGVLATNTSPLLAETSPERNGTAGTTQTEPSAPIEAPPTTTTAPPTTTTAPPTTTTAPPTTTTAPPTTTTALPTTTTAPPTATTQPELLQGAPAAAAEAAAGTGTLSITKEVIGSSGGSFTIDYRGPCGPGRGHCTQDHGQQNHDQDGVVGSVTLAGGATQTVTVPVGDYVISEPVVPDGATVSYSATLVEVTEGNTTSVTVTNTFLDTTDPVVTITTPAQGAVFELAEVVNADFSCSDPGGSGIASCVVHVVVGAAVDTSSVGAKTFSVTATDNGRKRDDGEHTYDVVDTGDPVVTITTPADGAVIEINSVVLADFSCSDPGGSGIDSCVGDVADGAAIDTGTLGAKSFTVTGTDVAGNETEVTHSYTVVDTGDPVVTITTPADGAVIEINSVVLAEFSCSDPGGSGIDSCVGDVADGAAIDTGTLGAKSFTVTGTDVAGNETEVTHSYTVVDTAPPVVTIATPG